MRAAAYADFMETAQVRNMELGRRRGRAPDSQVALGRRGLGSVLKIIFAPGCRVQFLDKPAGTIGDGTSPSNGGIPVPAASDPADPEDIPF